MILNKKTSVKTKINVAIVGLVVFFGLVATYMVYVSVNKLLTREKEESYKNIANEHSYIVKQLFDYASLVPQQLALNPKVVSYLESGNSVIQDSEILRLLEDFRFENVLSTVYLMDRTGNTLVSTDPTFVGNNYSFRDYFQNAVVNGNGVDMVLGVTSKEPGYYFSSAVKNKEEVVLGVVVVKMYTSVIDDIFKNHQIGSVKIVDKTGVIVFSTNINEIFKSLGYIDDADLKLIKDSRRFSDLNINPLHYDELQEDLMYIVDPKSYLIVDQKAGINELTVLDRVADYPIYIVMTFDRSEFMSTSRTIAGIIALFVALAALSSVIVISTLLSKFLSPLDSLKKVAQLISQGFYSERVPIESNDEFSSVGNAINTMLNDIQNSKEITENQIKEQTQKIKIQNDDLAEQQLALLNLLEDIEEEKAITELQTQDLKKFRMAVENASDHIVITDPEGLVIFTNNAVSTITGFSSSEIIGEKAGTQKLWGGKMSPDFYKEMWQKIKVDKQVFKGEFINKRKDGSEYYSSATITPVLDDNEEIIYFIGIERDITAQKEVDKMKTEFISLASHQLRTPLSAMKWFLELLIGGDAGELNNEQKEFINNINESNERMIDLVESLLNVSRIESGKIVLDTQPTNLRELIDSLVPELKNKIDQNKQKLTISVDGEIPMVNADPKLIRNVFMNLLTNSIKYTPGGGQINIYLAKKDNEVVSRVSDTGYGIPESEQHRTFEKFYRGTNIIDRVTDGNGLGLYLVKSIIESSGGKIWFESKENEGTTFWFTLPVDGKTKKNAKK